MQVGVVRGNALVVDNTFFFDCLKKNRENDCFGKQIIQISIDPLNSRQGRERKHSEQITLLFRLLRFKKTTKLLKFHPYRTLFLLSNNYLRT